MLGHVIVALEEGGQRMVEVARRRDQERLREEQRRRELAAEATRAAHERALAKDLSEMTGWWAESQRLRAFLAAVEERIPPAMKSDAYVAWVAWARRRADDMDPLSRPEGVAKVLEPRTEKDDRGA
jgi:hypothetical protein